MSEFMVVLRGKDPELKSYDRTEAKRLMEMYVSWVDHLKRENRYRGGSPMKEGSKLLRGKQELVMIQDAPYQANAEALTGYFVIGAKNLAEAVDVARGCPALSHGESVEVIALDN